MSLVPGSCMARRKLTLLRRSSVRVRCMRYRWSRDSTLWRTLIAFSKLPTEVLNPVEGKSHPFPATADNGGSVALAFPKIFHKLAGPQDSWMTMSSLSFHFSECLLPVTRPFFNASAASYSHPLRLQLSLSRQRRETRYNPSLRIDIELHAPSQRVSALRVESRFSPCSTHPTPRCHACSRRPPAALKAII